MENKVNIRPGVSILTVLKHIEYDPWYAVAEFVDNSIDSYLIYQKELHNIHGDGFKLEVEIICDSDESKIIIKDNAAGIHEEDYARAFRAAEIPPDTSGLSEFGMGMKSAACWFSDYWIVRTTALGEAFEKSVTFDMNKIFHDKLEELQVDIQETDVNNHYTVIELYQVSRMIKGRTKGKVKDHLASIYRDFIRKDILNVKLDDYLYFESPKILNTPYHVEPGKPDGENILWKLDIDFDVDENLSVKGFSAIRETGSTSEAGFALFRRGRVIEGSYDEGFRPEIIFGSPNSFRFQRVFGELHLKGFGVSFTKKGVKWDDNMDVFLELLQEEMDKKEFPLLKQAENYRVRTKDDDYKKTAKALGNTTRNFEQKVTNAVQAAKENKEEEKNTLTETKKRFFKKFQIEFRDITWEVTIEMSYDPSLKDLYELGDHFIPGQQNKDIRQIGIRLSLTHPFMVNFIGIENPKVESVLRIIASLGISEILAKESGAKTQGEIRRNFNKIINEFS